MNSLTKLESFYMSEGKILFVRTSSFGSDDKVKDSFINIEVKDLSGRLFQKLRKGQNVFIVLEDDIKFLHGGII